MLKALPKFTMLQRGETTAEIFKQKDNLLREILFPAPVAVKLNNITTAYYPLKIPIPSRAS